MNKRGAVSKDRRFSFLAKGEERKAKGEEQRKRASPVAE
jgi:hypothetical protein